MRSGTRALLIPLLAVVVGVAACDDSTDSAEDMRGGTGGNGARTDSDPDTQSTDPSTGETPLLCPSCVANPGGDTSDFGGGAGRPGWDDPSCVREAIPLEEARDMGLDVWPFATLRREFEAEVRWEHAQEHVATATLRIDHPGIVTFVHGGDGDEDGGAARWCNGRFWALEEVTFTVDTSDGFVQQASFEAMADTSRFSDMGAGFGLSGNVSASARGTLEFPVPTSSEETYLWISGDVGPRLPGLDTRMSLRLSLMQGTPPGLFGHREVVGPEYEANPPDGCATGGFSPDLNPDLAQYGKYCESSGLDGIVCCGWVDAVVHNDFRLPGPTREDDGGT